MLKKVVLYSFYLSILSGCQLTEVHINTPIARTFELIFEQQPSNQPLQVNRVLLAQDDGYVLIGQKASRIIEGEVGFWIKTDEKGVIQESIELGVSLNELKETIPYDIIRVDGGYAMVAKVTPPESAIKPFLQLSFINEAGIRRWPTADIALDNIASTKLTQTVDGSIYVASGSTVVKHNAAGEVIWRKDNIAPFEEFAGINIDAINTILPDTDNGFTIHASIGNIIQGIFKFTPTGELVRRIDQLEAFTWPFVPDAQILARLNDQTLIISGLNSEFLPEISSSTIFNLGQDGTDERVVDFENIAIKSIQPTTDGGFIACGATVTNFFAIDASPRADAILIKFNSDFKEEWREVYGTELPEEASDVVQLADGGFVFGGMTRLLNILDNPGNRAIYLVRTDRNGEL